MYKIIFCVTFLSLLIEGFDIYHSQSSKQFFQSQTANNFTSSKKRREIDNFSKNQTSSNDIIINDSILKVNIQQQIITINLLDYEFYEIKYGNGFSYDGLSADCLSKKITFNFTPIKILFQNGNNCYLLDISILDIYIKNL